MALPKQQPAADLSEPLPQTDAAPFLVLGGEAPPIPGANFDYRPGQPCAGIILVGKVAPADFNRVLEEVADPALPVADFGNNPAIRRDLSGASLDPSTFAFLEKSWAPIWWRLSEIPYKEESGSRAELAILRIAHSRQAPIEARFDAASQHLVEYPLLGNSAGVRRQLETLAGLELLTRTHFARTHACRKCGSSRLNVYEACPSCGGGELHEEMLVHHYRCGFQEAESHFIEDQFLICPKCRRTLHHLGIDYDKPGKVAVCSACHAANSDPPLHFICIDCSAMTPTEDSTATDWYHYRLTDEGIRSLRDGHLPRFDIGPLLAGGSQTHPPQAFRLLAMHELKIAKRYDRLFSVARFTVLNLDKVIREHGPVAADAEFRRLVAAVLAELRQCDFIGVGSDISGVIGFPETSAEEVEEIAERIRELVQANTRVRVELGIEIAEGDAIVELLSRS
jgi:hypothetical protein